MSQAPTPVLIQASPASKVGFECFGGAAELWRYKGPEVIISGGYETGKTIAALQKLNALLAKYPNSRALMVRKTYTSIIHSAVVTYESKVLPIHPDSPRSPIRKFGKSKPEWYDYPNGSRLVVGGMDNADRVLSAEYDFVYVNQAEELTLDDWEKLTGRATGRAGNAPYSQVMGDCNPGTQFHWIKQRQRLRLIESRHEDNPTLYDRATGTWTAQGRRTIEALDALTGVRYKRGRLGLWVAAEGQVYDFDPAIHVLPRDSTRNGLTGNPDAPIPGDWRRLRSIDFGYTNPFVCGWFALDSDDRLYLYREMYMTQRTVKVHARGLYDEESRELVSNGVVQWSEGENIEATVADHDAGDRATLRNEAGIVTTAADKDIRTGITAVRERLKIAGDNQPRFFILEGALVEMDLSLKKKFRPTSTIEEFAGYVYPEVKTNKEESELPVKMDDHGMDMLRYLVKYVDPTSKFNLRWL